MDAQDGRIRLLYFARLREAFGVSEESMPLGPHLRTVGDLRAQLAARGGPWADELAPARPVRFAVNQTLCTVSHALSPGDEVAVFPPVTGG